MKKNFMAIASLLIAAMFLVVSCAPEANVEGKVEDGLVNASLMATAAGKALTVTHEGAPLTYSVTLTAGWTADPNYKMDEVVGAKTINNADISKAINLGWISQGLWTVTVEGKRGSDVVVTGSTTKYITNGTDADKSVVVFLKTDTTSSKRTAIDFDITVNELAAGNNGYSLKASIVSADGREKSFNNDYTSFVDTDNGNNTRTYKITNNADDPVVSLTPGYYKVTLQLLKDTNVIGGITRGVLVTGESKITIMGSVSASDFANGSLSVYTPTVNISKFTAVTDASDSDNFKLNYDKDYQCYKGTATDADGSYKITYTVEASLDGYTGSGVTVNPVATYTWIVDGKVVTTNTEEVKVNNSSCEVTYSAPGNKNVTCIVTYACEATIGLTNYSFTIGNEAVASVLVKGPTVTGEVTTQTP